MSTEMSRIGCKCCGCVFELPLKRAGILNCPRCNRLIAIVDKQPDDMQMVVRDLPAEVVAKPKPVSGPSEAATNAGTGAAQAASAAQDAGELALAELVRAGAGSNAPVVMNHAVRLRETKARRNTAIIWMLVLLAFNACLLSTPGPDASPPHAI